MADEELNTQNFFIPSAPDELAKFRKERLSRVQHKDLSRDPQVKSLPQELVNGIATPVLGDYLLLNKLGQGGMASVYHGYHRTLGAEAAIKIPLKTDAQALRRFRREAHASAMVNSPYFVRVFDIGETFGVSYMVMEYVQGNSASEYLEKVRVTGQTGLPEINALEICIAATKGLAAAHRIGLLHRDIKPDNILIPAADGGGLDFNVAKLADMGFARGEDWGGMTLSGMWLGTPGFLAPEQASDAKYVGKPADVFCMGATLYALLTGEAPFTEKALRDILNATCDKPHDPIWVRRPGISHATATLIDRCLQKQPADRYLDGPELLFALSHCREAVSMPALLPDSIPTRLFSKTPEKSLSQMPTKQGGITESTKEHRPLWISEADGGASLNLFLEDSAWIETIRIPAGEFEMGAGAFEEDERPIHRVALSKPFYMARFPITQDQYQSVMKSNPSRYQGGPRPVENISWQDATDYCETLSKLFKRTIRLPTEAEWEYACRAGESSRFYAGDDDSTMDICGWYVGNSNQQTHPVGLKQPNKWGLYDMHGNVWEWCRDRYGPYEANISKDPQGPQFGRFRVLRGGSWIDTPSGCRCARRGRLAPDHKSGNYGFRIVVDA